jgi:transposase
MDPTAAISAFLAALPTLEQLPDDLGLLKQMILELLLTLRQERHDKQALHHRIDLLLRRVYGSRNERFDPNQPLLFDAQTITEAQAQTAPPSEANPDDSAAPPRRRARPHGRRRLPDNLRREVVPHELSMAERLCSCGQVRNPIGFEQSEQLDYQPASLFVWQHHTYKYACPVCAARVAQATAPLEPLTSSSQDRDVMTEPDSSPGRADDSTNHATPSASNPDSVPIGPVVISAPKPPTPIAKGLPGPGLLAHLIVSKYVDHLPLYRLERIYQRQGVLLPRSTTCDWLAACAELLRPLYDLMVTRVLQSRWLHTDDTTVKNQQPQEGATATSRLWVYLGDTLHPCNVFDFTATRRRDGPQRFLAGFRGYLHADAFSGYDALYLPAPGGAESGIIEVACNAHARRKFYEARASDALRSHQALAYYGQLYDIERHACQWAEPQRLAMRQDLSLTILEKFKNWLESQRSEVLPKSPMAEAIGYALNNWSALIRYTEAGFLSIDNNVAEREMKRIAIGRKNWLFVGSDHGGRTAAVLLSFASSCQRLAVEPWAYLQDVLGRLPTTPVDELEALLPDRWQAARASQGEPSKGNTGPPASPPGPSS